MKITTYIFFFLLALSNISLAEEKKEEPKKTSLEHGAEMHNNHCYKCHTDKVYTRSDRFVKSINALGRQVVRCKDGSNTPWFDEDTDAVVNFLNKKYYKF